MPQMRFRVSPDGHEPFVIPVTSRDIGMWERTTKGASLSKFETNAMMSDMEAIAFHACRRAGRFDGSLASFRETCDIEEWSDEDEDDEENPT